MTDGPGADDPVRIDLPKGTYVPTFAPRAGSAETAVSPGGETRPRATGRWVATLAVVALAIVTWVRSSRPPAREQPTVAVLPFVNLSDDSSDEYFSDGLTEEIIDRLARVEGLRVVARSSSFQFREAPGDLRDVGRRLNASAVVEGSVRRSGDTLRVTAQLVNAEDGYQLWSQRYEREASDVFAIQDEIARGVAEALRVELRVGGEPPPAPPTTSVEAHNLYLRGRYHVMHDALPGLELAADSLQRATETDPEYAAAHAALAQIHALLAYYRLRLPEEAWPRAAAAARRAIALEPTLAEAHSILGLVKAHFDWEWDEGERLLRHALELNPDSSDVHVAYTWGGLTPRGRTAEALTHTERAIELDPGSTLAYQLRSFALLIEGRYDEAIGSYRRQTEMNPSHADSQWDLGMALAYAGHHEEAMHQFQLAGRIRGNASWAPGPTEFMLLGEPERARAVIETWEGSTTSGPSSSPMPTGSSETPTTLPSGWSARSRSVTPRSSGRRSTPASMTSATTRASRPSSARSGCSPRRSSGAREAVRGLIPAMHVSERPLRRAERRVPAHPVLVSAEAEGMRATGEAVNLSDGGACLALDEAMLTVGDELILQLHSGQARQAVPATGRVVWIAPDRRGTRCGLEWTHAGPQRQWIGWLAEA